MQETVHERKKSCVTMCMPTYMCVFSLPSVLHVSGNNKQIQVKGTSVKVKGTSVKMNPLWTAIFGMVSILHAKQSL